MREFDSPVEPQEAISADTHMEQHAPGALSGLWYVTATNFGAMAVERLANGRELSNPRAFAGFVGEIAVTGIAASKGISNLEDFIASRRSKRAEKAASLASAQ